MTNVIRKLLSVTIALVTAVSLCPTSALAADGRGAKATGSMSGGSAKTFVIDEPSGLGAMASYENLREAGLKFDLKASKDVYFTQYLRGAKASKFVARVTAPKITTLSGNRKKATFTVSLSLQGFSTAQRNAVFTALRKGYSADQIFGGQFWGLVDYTTGKSLLASDNARNVVATRTETFTNTKRYAASDGKAFNMVTARKIKFSVTYPASYKGMCLVVGGMTYPFASRNTTSKEFWSSTKTTYYKTQYYKKNQTNAHFMRIY